MPYCYACRNSKPATHAHFVDYGALAMRPPKRHISAIEEEWDTLSEEQRAQALDIGRQLLAAAQAGEEGETAPAPRRPASSSPRSSAPRAPRERSGAQEGEGDAIGVGGWLAIGAAAAGLLGALWYGARNTGGMM